MRIYCWTNSLKNDRFFPMETGEVGGAMRGRQRNVVTSLFALFTDQEITIPRLTIFEDRQEFVNTSPKHCPFIIWRMHLRSMYICGCIQFILSIIAFSSCASVRNVIKQKLRRYQRLLSRLSWEVGKYHSTRMIELKTNPSQMEYQTSLHK